MSDSPEVIVLSDSDDDLNQSIRNSLRDISSAHDDGDRPFPFQGNFCLPKFSYEEEDQDLPDIIESNDPVNTSQNEKSSTFKNASTKPNPFELYYSKQIPTIDSSHSSEEGSQSQSQSVKTYKSKKPKVNLNETKGINDTSTDEIDSDDCSPVNIKTTESSLHKKVASTESQQPCCSKSLSMDTYEPFRSSGSGDLEVVNDFELPDIEEHNFEYPVSTSLKTADTKNTRTETVNAKIRKKDIVAEKRKAEKEQKMIAKELKMAELEREKALKKSEKAIQKNSKPGEAIKFITILVDKAVSEKHGTLLSYLDAAEIKYEINDTSLVPNSFTFKRETIHRAMGDDLQLHNVSSFADEDQIMILMDSNETIPMIHAHLMKQSGSDHESEGIDIITWMDSIKSEYANKKITLFFYGMDNYFRRIKKNTQQDFRDRVLHGGNQDGAPKRKQRKGPKQLPEVSKLEFQSALIELQIRTEVNYRTVKNVNELAPLLIQYAKAIAEAPFKRQKMTDNGFDWYALADSTGSVRVDKDGNGLRALWIMQLQCFNNVGVDIAKAIAEKYSSPQALSNAFLCCPTVEDGHALLKDIQVKVGIGPLSRYRKLGPELSKRMYRFFTSTDGERFLSSTADM